jgi:hypothetical protein
MNGTAEYSLLTYSVVDDEKMGTPLTTAPSTRPTSSPSSEQPNITAIDIEAKGEEPALVAEAWIPTKNEWLIMISLAFISLMVALDATILVTVLPVSHTFLLATKAPRADYNTRK